MPIQARNKATEKRLEKISRSTDICQICETPISPDKLGSPYCLNCNLKYAEQIRIKEQKIHKELAMREEIF